MNDPLGLTPEQRRAAEERLRAQYEAELTRTIELGPEDRTLWPVRSGRVQLFESESGAFAEELRLEGSFPDTRFVLTYRHQLRPGHRFERAGRSGLATAAHDRSRRTATCSR